MSRQFSRVVSLVGENPLPVYLGLRQYLAPGGESVLVCSEGPDGTEPIAQGIARACPPGASHRLVRLANPYDPKMTGLAMDAERDVAPDALLNYTGGTKVMSAYALRAWAGSPDRTMYLAERDRLFMFGDGLSDPLVVRGLTIDTLCDLHGVARGTGGTCTGVSYADLKRLLDARGGRELPRLRSLSKAEIPAAWMDRNSAEFGQWIDVLSADSRARLLLLPLNRQIEFLANNEWFEDLVRAVILRLHGTSGDVAREDPPSGALVGEHEVATRVHFFLQREQFESDLMAVVNFALRYASVTTDPTEGRVKGKAFEAIHRARQIGGDMARSCVVSLAPADTVARCRRSINETRNAVFGDADIRRWIAGDGSQLLSFMTD